MTFIAALSGKSLAMGLIAGPLGITLATVGLEPETAVQRLTFGSINLFDGLLIEPFERGFTDIAHIRPQVYDRDHGEIRWILERGYSTFALMGPHRFFHLVSDGPEVSTPDLLQSNHEALLRSHGEIAGISISYEQDFNPGWRAFQRNTLWRLQNGQRANSLCLLGGLAGSFYLSSAERGVWRGS